MIEKVALSLSRRPLAYELGKWVLRDTFEGNVNFKTQISGYWADMGRCCAHSRDGTYVFRIFMVNPVGDEQYARAYRPLPIWKEEILYAYAIPTVTGDMSAPYFEIILRPGISPDYVWGVRFGVFGGDWKYLASDGTWKTGSFTFSALNSGETAHLGLVVSPSHGTYVALYVRGTRYDIHTLEAPTGVTIIDEPNYFSYGVYSKSANAVFVDIDEVGVAVL